MPNRCRECALSWPALELFEELPGAKLACRVSDVRREPRSKDAIDRAETTVVEIAKGIVPGGAQGLRRVTRTIAGKT